MHGGDIYSNHILLDFSVNINPLGTPKMVKKSLIEAIEEVEYYPDISCRQLKASIAKKLNLSIEQIICGNGASELILAICCAVRPLKALLLSPCFSGYELALHAVKSTISFYPLKEKQGFELDKDILGQIVREVPDIFFITNPNNPTGKLISKELMKEIADTCSKLGTILVIDECFIELTGKVNQYSFISELYAYKNVVILRAFTKSFAIPGVRLGYLICPEGDFVEQINLFVSEWNVSILAQRAGITAMQTQNNYLKEACKLIEQEREYLSVELKKLEMKVYESYANYILFFYDKSSKDIHKDLYELLIRQHILIRDCRDYQGLKSGYYRIAVKCHEENIALIKALKKVL